MWKKSSELWCIVNDVLRLKFYSYHIFSVLFRTILLMCKSFLLCSISIKCIIIIKLRFLLFLNSPYLISPHFFYSVLFLLLLLLCTISFFSSTLFPCMHRSLKAPHRQRQKMLSYSSPWVSASCARQPRDHTPPSLRLTSTEVRALLPRRLPPYKGYFPAQASK